MPHGRLQGCLEVFLSIKVSRTVLVHADDGMSIENDVLKLGNLVDDLGNILQLAVLALPLVHFRENIEIGLEEAEIGNHRRVGRQAELLLELSFWFRKATMSPITVTWRSSHAI